MNDGSAMRQRQRRVRKPRKQNTKMPLQFDEQAQAITNYFQVKVKSNVADEHGYNRFVPLHTNYSDPDEEESGESDDAMQQFNGFDFNNQANVSVTTPNAAKRTQLKASGSLSTDYDDYEDNDEDDGDDDDDDNDGSGSSTSQNSIQPTNIFLQKPVLHLNIDKSPNQPSSIVINKHLDVVHPSFTLNFAAFNNSISRRTAHDDDDDAPRTADTAHTNLNNNNFTQNQPLADERKRKSFSQQMQAKLKRTKRMSKRASGSSDNGLIDALNHSDSNSCDSGVVVDKSFEAMAANAIKPTTPHRIVCPSTSPVKHFKDPQQSTNNNQSPKLTSTPKARAKSSKRK